MHSRIVKGIRPGLAEQGKIKIGGLIEKARTSRAGNTWHAPAKFKDFHVTKLTRLTGAKVNLDPDEPVMAKLREFAGDDGPIDEIPVLLPYDDPDLNFPTSYRAYGLDGRLFCRCEGVEAERKGDDGFAPFEGCTCPYLNDEKAQKKDGVVCKPYGILYVILPFAETLGGAYVFRTTSLFTINAILGSMDFIRSQTHGVLSGIPLTLKLFLREHSTPSTKKSVSPAVTLVFKPPTKETAALFEGSAAMALNSIVGKLVDIRAKSATNIKGIEGARRLALASASPDVEIDGEDPERVAEEFTPRGINDVVDLSPSSAKRLPMVTRAEQRVDLYGDIDAGSIVAGKPDPENIPAALLLAAGKTILWYRTRLAELEGDDVALLGELDAMARSRIDAGSDSSTSNEEAKEEQGPELTDELIAAAGVTRGWVMNRLGEVAGDRGMVIAELETEAERRSTEGVVDSLYGNSSGEEEVPPVLEGGLPLEENPPLQASPEEEDDETDHVFGDDEDDDDEGDPNDGDRGDEIRTNGWGWK